MKKDFKIVYFFAKWDGNYETHETCREVCEARGWKMRSIDCETRRGVEESIKYNVKLCPYIIVYDHNKEIMRGIANNILDELL